jgi:hypothetical protein
MKSVEIAKAGNYSLFDSAGVNVGREYLNIGDQRHYPDDYANGLIDSKLAEPVGVEATFRDDEDQINISDVTAAALKLAKANAVDIAYIFGTGANGKITVDDVKTAIEANEVRGDE